MVIKAKARTVLRLIGAILILFGLISAIVFNIGFFYNFIAYIIIFSILLPWLLFSTFLKLEYNFFIENHRNVFLLLIIYSIVLLILPIIWDVYQEFFIIVETLTSFLLIACWHFSLSIIRKEKLIFVFSGILYLIFKVISIWQISFLQHPIIIMGFIIILFGFVLILIIEFTLRKSGFLKYI